MKRGIRLAACVCLLVGVAGCGDTPYTILRDFITAWAEMADLLSKVTDEESAGAVVKDHFAVLKNRWEGFKKRHEVTTRYDKEEKTELNRAIEYYKTELFAAALRWEHEINRLSRIRADLAEKKRRALKLAKIDAEKEFPKLTECINSPKTFIESIAKGFGSEVKGGTQAPGGR